MRADRCRQMLAILCAVLAPAAIDSTPLPKLQRPALPLAVAHRGASGNAPENTMAAFRLAHNLFSAGVETDLHLTRDGVVVLLHDVDIRRTTRGWPDNLPSYRIDHLDWSFVQTLDAGSWFAPEFAGERVPQLSELLDFAAETEIMVYLDVKSTATGLNGLAAIRDELLAHTGRGSYHVDIGVWSELALAEARDLGLPSVGDLSFIAGTPPLQSSYSRFRDLGCRSFNINHVLLSAAWVEAAQQAQTGVGPVFAWTVNEPSTIERMVNIGVTAIVTDYPERVPQSRGNSSQRAFANRSS